MYEELCSYENLLKAFDRAKKGKSKKHYIVKFQRRLKENLERLQHELINETYKPSPLKIFIVRDPKTRKISKSRFRDRVIHHDLINVIGNIFEKKFIHDSHANQLGKGTLKAVERFNVFKRKVSKNGTKTCYVLKADIKHYFDEINHEVLLNIIKRDIKDEKVISLMRKILQNSDSVRNRGGGERLLGMPLGNYTSQFFANVYLNELDQYVKHKLRAKYYIRYVDDFVILHNSKEQLIKWKEEINNFLKEKLKIELHQQKSGVLNLSGGITFLGFRIFTHHMLIRGSNLEKFNRRLEILEMLYNEEEITRNEVVEHLEGWLAFIKYANMHKYTMRLLKSFNKSFPIRKEMGQILDSSKKTANFLKKIDFSKLEFSVQQTLHLFSEKKMKPKQIADIRKLKESTIWKHLANLIEYGQWSLWKVIKKKKIIQILPKIISGNDKLKDIKERLSNPFITYDEINCVLAHIKFKEKIKQ